MRRKAVRVRVACALAGTFGLWAAPARAVDAEVQSDTSAQFYDVRSPTGETVLGRRRVTSTLAVSGYELMDRPLNDPMAPQLLFRARLRYDADYGVNGAETDVTNFGRVVPGLNQAQTDLMYAYIEGRKFLGGWLGFKAGRQYVTDVLGWYSFDGGELHVTTPFYVAVEGYGGLEARGGMPLTTSRFETDGIWRGDRSNYDPSLYPSFQPSAVAPVVAAAVESTGVTWLHGRLTYRRVVNTGESNTAEWAGGLYGPSKYSGSRISQEKIGYSLDASVAQIGSLRGGLIYDLYSAAFGTIYGNLDAFLGRGVTVGVDYQYYQPTFDGDSIWNFFVSEPRNDIGGRASWSVNDHFALSASGRGRIYTVQTAEDSTKTSPNNQVTLNPPYFPSNSHPYDGGGDLSARYRFGEGWLGARASGSFGGEGDRVGGDVSGERVFEGRYVVEGRLNLWQWQDKLRPDRDATSFGYVAGLGYRFAPRSQALFEMQQDTNRLVGSRFRAMLFLTVAVTK